MADLSRRERFIIISLTAGVVVAGAIVGFLSGGALEALFIAVFAGASAFLAAYLPVIQMAKVRQPGVAEAKTVWERAAARHGRAAAYEGFSPLDTDELLDALRRLVGRWVTVRVSEIHNGDDVSWRPVNWLGGVILAVNPSPLDARASDVVAWDVWVGDPDDARDIAEGMKTLGGFQVTPHRVDKAVSLPDGYGVVFTTQSVSVEIETVGPGGGEC